MPKTNFQTSSRTLFMTCFMLVLVVFSTTMRFVGVDANLRLLENRFEGIENTEIDYSLINKLDKEVDTKKNLSNSDNQQEKEPLTLKTATSSDALLQGFVTTEFFQNIILTSSIEFVFPSFSSQTINSVTYYFSSSTFFKTLFSCFISPNAP
ncbi:hypothetical protein V9L05_16010 [Bernardetia sp. Wsw4-3y2]|uniref:hypothetical protein n=1 Tax=unclassified Bernardetia TaxID=2647129 RepID=UPI0030CB50A6